MKSVAIDGPAGAGKSTIAKKLANKLGFIYVDTGALYRAIGLYVLSQDADSKNENEVIQLIKNIKVELKYIDDSQRVILNEKDVTGDIRTAGVSMAASNVSAMKKVREFLLDMQRNLAKENNVVMDGRDIGTVVLPFADVKIFLTASPEERAKRRYDEMLEKGMKADFKDVLEDLKIRDYNDSNRKIAPLKPSRDSIIVDTTGNTLEQSIEVLTNVVVERLNSNEKIQIV